MPSFTLFSFRFIECSAKPNCIWMCVHECEHVHSYGYIKYREPNGIVSFRTWPIPQCGSSGCDMYLSLTNCKMLMQINQPYIVLYYSTLIHMCVRNVWAVLINWSIDLGTFLQQNRIISRVQRCFFRFSSCLNTCKKGASKNLKQQRVSSFRPLSPSVCVWVRIEDTEMINRTPDCPHIRKMLWSKAWSCAFLL